MENFFTKNTEFAVIPNDIEMADVFLFEESNVNYITLHNPEIKSQFTKGDNIEIFSRNDSGTLYFKSKISDFKNGYLIIKYPEKYDIIQRREDERFNINDNITIFNETQKFEAKLINLSIGGLKIKSNTELNLNKKYKISLNIQSKFTTFEFIPTRIETDKNKYISSGTISTNDTNTKIEFIQYCYRKIFEQQNRINLK